MSITPDMTRRQVEVARTVNNLNKAFRSSLAGTNTTIKTFSSEEDFYNSSARMRAVLELDLKDDAVTYGKVFKKLMVVTRYYLILMLRVGMQWKK